MVWTWRFFWGFGQITATTAAAAATTTTTTTTPAAAATTTNLDSQPKTAKNH